MVRNFLFFISILFTINIFAQSPFVVKGDKLMAKGFVDKAATLYKKAADKDANDVEAREKLGKTFLMTGDNTSAESVFKALSENPLAKHINKFYYAQVLRINGKYNEADAAYKQFASAVPNDPRSTEFKNFADDIKKLGDLKMYEMYVLPDNSTSSEIGPAFNNGRLFFSSNRSGIAAKASSPFWYTGASYDVYEQQSAGAGESVTPSKLPGKVNKKLNEGPAVFSRDGREMIFTRTNYKSKSKIGVRTLGLYSAQYDTSKHKWTNIKPLPFNNKEYNVAHPSLSKDGKQLFFISDMEDSISGTDIYMSIRTGKTWEKPIKLSNEINTPGRELFPFIADDGTLYFSSDSRIGFGGLDLYAASPTTNNKWTGVRNLGAGINTNADDFGYVSDETDRNGFFVSNRTGGVGGDDIYKFKRLLEQVCGAIIDSKTKNKLPGITVSAVLEKDTITTVTDSKGDFCFYLKAESVYKLQTHKDGYADFASNISVKNGKNSKKTIEVKPQSGIELVVDVAQKDSGALEGATAFLINKATGEVQERKSDATGKVKFDLQKDQEYDLKVVKKKQDQKGVYDKFVKTISTMGFSPSQKLNENAQLTYYNDAAVFDLPNVFFDYGSYSINPAAAAELNKVAKVMKLFPEINVEIGAHTDSRGKAQFNMVLSAERASACVDYLVSKGVDKTHIIAIGFGELKIRNKCIDYVPCTDAEHAVNRRTEFKVVNFD